MHETTCQNRVNLFLVGAPKCGTTSIYELLKSTGEVDTPSLKEPGFFLANAKISQNTNIYSEKNYHSLYRWKKGYQHRLDASTGYLYDEEACNRIFNYNPNANIVITLRNPIRFCISYWEYMTANGSERLPFESAISASTLASRKAPDFASKCIGWAPSYWYTERAKYYQQVKRYLDRFPREQVCVLVFEHFTSKPQSLRLLLQQLGIDMPGKVSLPRANGSGNPREFIKWLRFSSMLEPIKRPFKKTVPRRFRFAVRRTLWNASMTQSNYARQTLSEETVSFLRDLFFDDVEQIKSLLPEIDFDCWPEFSTGRLPTNP